MVGSVLLERMRAEADFELVDPVFFTTSAVGAAGIAALAWREQAVGPEGIALALGRLTLASGVWAHVVLLLGGLVFGLVARRVAHRCRCRCARCRPCSERCCTGAG